MTDGPRPLPGDAAKPKPRGQNAYQAFLTSLARDVPRELKRSAAVRRALRRGVR